MVDKVLESFLTNQHSAAMKLADESDILELHPLDGPPPQHYIATFHAKGLAQLPDGQVITVDRCDVGIWLPDDYLRQVEVVRVLTYLGPHPNPWHPNFRRSLICVHLTPGMPLVDLLYTVFEMWTYRLYYTGDEGLNRAASQWVRRQEPSSFPVDARPLKRRTLPISVAETVNGGPDR